MEATDSEETDKTDDPVERTRRAIVSGVSDGAVHRLSEDDIKDLCLDAHNYVRSLHTNDPPLVWNSDLADVATQWAEFLIQEGSIRHATVEERMAQCGFDCGENIYYKGRAPTGDVADSANAVFAWYNEYRCWDFETGTKKTTPECGSNPVTGHLTQVLWTSSTEVGCGVATISEDYINKKGILKKNKFQNTVIVARYSPPGNFKKQYAAKVPGPIDGVSVPASADDLRMILTI